MAKANRICSIDGCHKRAVVRRGWCAAHWARWKRHGDPTGGRNYDEKLRYFSEVVMAYEGDNCLIWPYSRTRNGYPYMGRHIVSRLVCIEVNGPPPTPEHEAAHECGRGKHGCVTKRHLSWKTPVENKADELIHGTRNRGERQGGSKLKEEDVREIRLLKGTISPRELAKRFGVSQGAISCIYRGVSWSWLV